MLNPQQRLVAEVARIFPDAVFYKQTTQRVMSLTIDDGPTPDELDDRSMQVILDVIAEHNQQSENPTELVRATFFIISSHLRENTRIIEKILQQGHEIGNHGVEDETTVLLTPKSLSNVYWRHTNASADYQTSLSGGIALVGVFTIKEC